MRHALANFYCSTGQLGDLQGISIAPARTRLADRSCVGRDLGKARTGHDRSLERLHEVPEPMVWDSDVALFGNSCPGREVARRRSDEGVGAEWFRRVGACRCHRIGILVEVSSG